MAINFEEKYAESLQIKDEAISEAREMIWEVLLCGR